MKLSHLFHHMRGYLTVQNAALLLGALIVLSWLWSTVVILQKNHLYQQQIDELDIQVQLADIEAQSLTYEQAYFRSDEYLELSARQRLHKSAAGEKQIILPARPAAPTLPSVSATIATPIVSPKATNFQQWMRFLFGS